MKKLFILFVFFASLNVANGKTDSIPQAANWYFTAGQARKAELARPIFRMIDNRMTRIQENANDKYKYVDSLRRADSAKLEAKKVNISALKDSAADIRLAGLTGNWKTAGNTQMPNSNYTFGVKNGIDINALNPDVPAYYGDGIKARFGFNTDSFNTSIQQGGKFVGITFDKLGIDLAINAAGRTRFKVNTGGGFSVAGANETGTGNFNSFQLSYFNTTAFNTSTLQIENGTSKGTITFLSKTFEEFSGFYNYFQDGIIYSNTTKSLAICDGTKIKKIPFSTEVILKGTVVPTSTSDTTGNVGDEISDENYKYIKTVAGWKRFALSTF